MDRLTEALYTLERAHKLQKAEDYELERLEAQAIGVGGTSYGDTPHGTGKGDRMESATIELANYREHIKRERRKRMPAKARALAVIHEELDDMAAYVIEAIYNRGLSTIEVSHETGYSVSWVYLQEQKGAGKR